MSSRDPRESHRTDEALRDDPRDARRETGREPDREGARVLSLEERKQQRQREREAARAARIAALTSGAEEPARALRPSKAERRARAQEERESRDADGPADGPTPLPGDDGAEPAGPRAVPGLGGVRPFDGLASTSPRALGTGGPLGPAAAPLARGPALMPPGLPGADLPAPLGPDEPPARSRRDREGREKEGKEGKDRKERREKGDRPDFGPSPEPASPARTRTRHWMVGFSFVLIVIVPTLIAAWYLWERASPRFASYAALSVRSEEGPSAVDILGGVAQLTGGSSTSDSQVLYEFLQSQEVVRLIDDRLDLRALWSKGDPERDPVFAFHPPGTIEDLHDYWLRMVSVYIDGATGLLDLEVQAFEPDDARLIMQAIVDEGTVLVNRLSDQAQADSTRYAEQDLADSVERLKTARAALTRFRNQTQIVDPTTAVASQMGLLSELESQLAQTLIDLDLLRQTVPASDPRITQAQSRVSVIESRMAAERAKLGLGADGEPAAAAADGTPTAAPAGPTAGAADDGAPAPGGEAFADLVGQYESLAVDQQFAEQAYTAARTAFDVALADSRRQSRYLAAHVQPTLAERAEYPGRVSLTLLTLVFGFLAWAILTLAAYALRDRR